jgi:Cdc6-like AAA superfamily ATPase
MAENPASDTIAQAAKISSKVELHPINVAPLTGDMLKSYGRLDEEVNRVASVVTQTEGGCLLITGYRGVGKTSFVNKVLFDAKATLEKKKVQLVVVQLNLARGYSTDKLLRRLIRELYHVINSDGLFEQLPPILQRKLDIAFMRTSHHLKTAMMLGLKEVVSKTSSETFSTANTYALAPEFGVDKLSLSLGSMAHQRSRSKTQEIMTSTEKARERGLEVDFLEYDDEIAENDLCSLINELQGINFSNETTLKQLKKPEWFWKILADEIQIGKRVITNYQLVKSDKPAKQKGIKIVFVLDEIDKMSVEQAEEIFRSLKNLFLQGNATFLMVTGKDFYYHWLLTRNTEDDILFSLFTGIFHIPLFSDDEFSGLANALIKTKEQVFPDDLLEHLKFKAKGTPREFLRELMRFAQWRNGKQVLSDFQGRGIALSATLYSVLKEIYTPYEQDDRIDIGLKDHVRRSLHHWLDKMILQVYFTKESLLRDKNKDKKSNDEEILIARSSGDLDNLLALLIKKHVIEEVELSDKKFYTFVKALREQMHEVIPTIGGELRLEQEKVLNNALDIVRDARELVSTGKFSEAKSLLDTIPDNRLAKDELNPVYEEVTAIREKVDLEIKKQALIDDAKKLYQSAELDRAIDKLLEVQNEFGHEPALTDNIQVWKLERDLAQVDRLLNMGRIGEAEALAQNSLAVFSVTQATRDLLTQIDLRHQKARQINSLFGRINLALDEGVVEHATTELEQLKILAGKANPVFTNAETKVLQAQDFLTLLERAQDAMRKGEWEAARNQLNLIEMGVFKFADSRCRGLQESIAMARMIGKDLDARINSKNIDRFNQALEMLKDYQYGHELLAEGLSLAKKEALLRKNIDVYQTLAEIRANLDKANLESAWDYWDHYGELIDNSSQDFEYKSLRRELENATITKAKARVEQLHQKYNSEIVRASTKNKDRPIEIYIDDVMVILNPLLQRDPDNKRAHEVIAMAKNILEIKDSQ